MCTAFADQVEERLGRPLSEVPELWWAAPKEALLWGAEEFDFLPSPRHVVTGDSEEWHLWFGLSFPRCDTSGLWGCAFPS